MPTTSLVVGSGFAGATYARMLAESGRNVHVIDRRPHIGGNAFDEVADTGVRIHRYGPHLFHTNMEPVVNWLTQFGKFVPYEHRVQAKLPSSVYAPLPINRTTINLVFELKLKTKNDVEQFLKSQAIAHLTPRNAAEHLESRIGKRLTNLFFRPYTKKMWNLDLEDLSADVVKRIPLRSDDEDRYFPDDKFQLLPRHGYTAVLANILDHDRILVTLNTPFDRSYLGSYLHCFNSMPIDEFFDECLGPLPYRSLRFKHRHEPSDYAQGDTSVVNFTDAGPHTRETDWSRLPFHNSPRRPNKTVTIEEPCDYKDNGLERYYPIKTSGGENEALYREYLKLAEQIKYLTFIGRCGTYQYLDMHQVINQSFQGARHWLALQSDS
jgi:UDP-galactopyranose mutase